MRRFSPPTRCHSAKIAVARGLILWEPSASLHRFETATAGYHLSSLPQWLPAEVRGHHAGVKAHNPRRPQTINARVRHLRASEVHLLESRRLLSASLEAGIWRITADALRRAPDDAIVVEPAPADASVLRAAVNGVEVGTAPLDGLQRVEIDAGRGNDRVTVRLGDGGASAGIAVHVLGGDGDDILTGSAAAEEFLGGRGNDRIDGGGGNDLLFGDAGNDELLGGDGDDNLRGGPGNDVLAGGWGRDALHGERGNDRLDGGAADDDLDGGTGADILVGGANADTIRGGKGADRLFHEEALDTLALAAGQRRPDRRDNLADDDTRTAALREQDDAELKKWVIDTAVRQWAWAFGQPVSPWAYMYGRGGEVMIGAPTEPGPDFGSGGPVPTVPPAPSPGVPADGNLSEGSGGTEGRTDTDGTNTQEAGVDEADLVETDGQFIYSLQDGHLVIVRASPADAMTVVSRTPIEGDALGIYRHGPGRLTVLTANTNWAILPMPVLDGGDVELRSILPPTEPPKTEVRVTVLDVSEPASPRTIEETVLDGIHGGSRLVDERLYLVLSNNTWVPEPLQIPLPGTDPDLKPLPEPRPTPDPEPLPPTTSDVIGGAPGFVPSGPSNLVYESEEAYRARLEALPLADLLPGYRSSSTGGESSGVLISATDTYVREATSPELGQNLTTLALLDVADDSGGPGATSTIAGYGGVVYASADALYLASLAWDSRGQQTNLFKFTLGVDAVPLAATGTVAGAVLNQFSMDEEGDDFRIATSGWSGDFTPGAPFEQSSSVYVLDQVGDDLEVIGSVTGLANGERLRSARFVGDKGYVVTFRQVDPLFTIDLADPRNPRVAGELKIPGFSSYLHPLEGGLLIGLGRDVDESGIGDRGLQLSLFDVSNPSNPRRVATYKLSERHGQSEAEFDHHAFAFFSEQRILVLPISQHDASFTAVTNKLVVLRLNAAGGADAFERLGEIVTPELVRRNVRIGDVLFAVGPREMQARDLNDPEALLGSVETWNTE